ncbi:MAG: DUF2490 domain-containing protein [Candidatus Korobacteraceae bacterium]|jgi:hypothetical protein
MAGIAEKSLVLASLVILLCLSAGAQTVEDQLLPEIDTYLKLTSDLRFDFQAKETRENGEPIQAEVGPSLDFFLKPLVRLQNATSFDLNDANSRPLVLSIGYRYLPRANGAPATNRMEPVVTFNYSMNGNFLLSDRNRADLDWSTNFTWRYRNRFQIERAITLRSYHPSPYASVEFFYQSKYSKWSDTALYAGCIFPIGQHVEFNPYYEHQNSTGSSPNQKLNQLGLMLNLYFSVR